MCSKQGLTLRELCLRFRLRTFRYFNQYLSRGIQFSRASLNAAPETADRSRDLFLWKRWMWQNNVYEINHKSCMRTVPGSEIVGSAELRRREHKKKNKTKQNKTKERKKERSQNREETGERKGGGACNLCQLFACLTLSRQFSPIISKPGTGYLTIG